MKHAIDTLCLVLFYSAIFLFLGAIIFFAVLGLSIGLVDNPLNVAKSVAFFALAGGIIRGAYLAIP